jgi:peptide/nickel transport system substrate-binding protein
LTRNPDYWGRELPFNAGQNNFDTIRVEYHRDGNALFNALQAGQVSLFRETDAARWQSAYDFEAVRDGLIERVEIPHGRPTGMNGFVFNTRNALFADVRVREALTLAFDFEWINRTLNRGAYARIRSPFGNSPLGHEGPAEGREREILAPHADELPEGALEGTMTLPETDGSGRNRRNLREAVRLLEAAGWTVRDGALRDAEGRAFAFEILLAGPEWEATASVFARALEPLGIEATVRLVDGAQYEARRLEYDYDMIVNRWAMSLSPGAEQRLYWGAYGREAPGTRNYAGVDSPAVEAAIDALLTAETREGFEAAARALDRALAWGAYVIPLWHAPASRIGWDGGLAFPERLPLYGDWIGWLPDVWWREDAR